MAGNVSIQVEIEAEKSRFEVEPREEAYEELPVLRPRLPTAAALMPYLHAIDQKKTYSNYGPLTLHLHKQLARHAGCDENRIVTVGSGTIGLTAALLALDVPEGSVCLMPSWTFAATAHAAVSAGLRPWFLDIDPRTWALEPYSVEKALSEPGCRASAVIVVSPFGAPVDLCAWERVQERTGVKVIVDAAAGFDTVRASGVTSVVSLHATKIFGAGEGGFVVTPDAAIAQRVVEATNFGFAGSRIAQHRALNGKLSEYHAAVALAGFEMWPVHRLAHLNVMNWYRQALRGQADIALQPGYGDGWVTGTTNIVLKNARAERVAEQLLRERIGTRMWWGLGCHTHPAFAFHRRSHLPDTDALAPRVLGLPHFLDLRRPDIAAVASALARALEKAPRK